jgi:hypothetical protein
MDEKKRQAICSETASTTATAHVGSRNNRSHGGTFLVCSE